MRYIHIKRLDIKTRLRRPRTPSLSVYVLPNAFSTVTLPESLKWSGPITTFSRTFHSLSRTRLRVSEYHTNLLLCSNVYQSCIF